MAQYLLSTDDIDDIVKAIYSKISKKCIFPSVKLDIEEAILDTLTSKRSNTHGDQENTNRD